MLYFKNKHNVVVWYDDEWFNEAANIRYSAEEWKLFMDSSVTCINAVSQYNDNTL